MKKLSYILLLTMLAISLLLSGCSANNESKTRTKTESKTHKEENKEADQKAQNSEGKQSDEVHVSVSVTNLVDDESKAELKSIMEKAGLPEEGQKVFWDHVNQYNEAIGADKLISGYKKMLSTESAFDEYDLQDLWDKKYPDFKGYNCRLTAYGLMGNLINVRDTSNPDTRNIFMDLDAADADSSIFIESGDKEKFEALFSTIAGENSTDQSKQIALVQKAWQDRGISVDDSACSLIELYMHAHYSDTDNEIFVGHAGVLIDAGNDGLYFVEKLAFQAPYRCIKLDSKEQLKNYLLERYKSYQSDGDAEAFVMENGKIM